MSKKCLVKGCQNHEDQGTFVGDLCYPCHEMLTTGRIHSSDITFIGELNRQVNNLQNQLNNVYKTMIDLIPS